MKMIGEGMIGEEDGVSKPRSLWYNSDDKPGTGLEVDEVMEVWWTLGGGWPRMEGWGLGLDVRPGG